MQRACALLSVAQSRSRGVPRVASLCESCLFWFEASPRLRRHGARRSGARPGRPPGPGASPGAPAGKTLHTHLGLGFRSLVRSPDAREGDRARLQPHVCRGSRLVVRRPPLRRLPRGQLHLHVVRRLQPGAGRFCRSAVQVSRGMEWIRLPAILPRATAAYRAAHWAVTPVGAPRIQVPVTVRRRSASRGRHVRQVRPAQFSKTKLLQPWRCLGGPLRRARRQTLVVGGFPSVQRRAGRAREGAQRPTSHVHPPAQGGRHDDLRAGKEERREAPPKQFQLQHVPRRQLGGRRGR